ncbi:MAG: twin-arginine translocase TatA/TatE family subunit [Gemmatimonadota bacterium]
MLRNIGLPEILLVLVVVLLLFGAKRLPEIGASFGKGMREFKHGLNHPTDEETGQTMARENRESLPADAEKGPTATRRSGEPKRLSE